MSFGHRVIGKEAADKAAAAANVGVNFGHRVTGKLAGQKATSEKATSEKATSEKPAGKPPAETTPTTTSVAVSADEARILLAENPALIDSIYEAEVAREAGPRRGVLELLRASEMAGEARPVILSELDVLLGANRIVADMTTAFEGAAAALAEGLPAGWPNTGATPAATEPPVTTPPVTTPPVTTPPATTRRSKANPADLAAARQLQAKARKAKAADGKPADGGSD